MLVSTLIDRILLQLAESTTDPNYLSRTQILSLVNHCNRVLTEQLDAFTKFGWIHCKENKPKYTLDSAIRKLLWVTYDGEELTPASIRSWEKYSKSWRSDRGDPTEYALDIEKQHVIWLYKCPSEDGDEFLFTSTTGIPYAIVDPYYLDFDAQTQDFTVGETVTGGDSGASGEILHVVQNGYDGTLYFEEDPGTFTDNETITDTGGGSATADGTTGASGGDTWTFSRSYGVVTEIVGDDGSFWDLVDENGEEVSSGVIDEIWTPVKNLIYKYSYYPTDLAETDHLLKPYREAQDMYLYFVMWHALMLEAEGQDLERAFTYASGFAQKSGIELTKVWTPQREYVMGSFQAESTTKSRVVLPDDYGPTEYD